jgi:exopolysaccharide biosynthesis polyprenyl glycosylphosphotransferase
MSISGIYLAPRSLIALGTELLWLTFSALVLCLINSVSIDEPISAALLLIQTAVIVTIYLSMFYLMDLYEHDLVASGRALLLNLAQAVGLVSVVFGVLEIGTRLLPFNPFLTFAHLSLTAIFVLCARAAIRRVEGIARPPVRVGIVAGEQMRQMLRADSERWRDYGLRVDWLGGSLGQAQAVLECSSIAAFPIRRLVIESEIVDDRLAVDFLQQCRERGLEVEDLHSFAERTNGKIILGPQLVRRLATSRNLGLSRRGRAVRRARDLILACFGLLITLPISLLTVLAIRGDSPGPALFKQERVGENGRRFTMFKFRSMYQDVKLANDREWTTQLGDPRITRVGRIIRSLHIDELPQLVNVITGKMSLVGPRPFHPAQVVELERLVPSFGLRHLVKPGITGWAQVTCDYDASVQNRDEVFARDLYYVRHASFLFDLLIMVITVRVCLWRRGSR